MTNYKPHESKYRPFIYVFNEDGLKMLLAFSIPYPWYGTFINPARFETAKKCWHLRYFKRGITLSDKGIWQRLK